MKYIFLFLIFTLSLYGKERIVVLDFVHSSNVSREMAVSSQNFFISELAKTEEFSIIEKSQLQEILKEVEFQQTGCTDTICEIKIGEMLSADKIASGSILKKEKKYIITITIRNVKDKSLEFSDTIDLLDINNLEITMNSLVDKMFQTSRRDQTSLEDINDSHQRSARWRTVVMPGWGHIYLGKSETGSTYMIGYLGSFGILYILSTVRQNMKKEVEAEVNTIRYGYLYAAQIGNATASNPFVYPAFNTWGEEKIRYKTQDIDSTIAIGSIVPLAVLIFALVDVQYLRKYNEKDLFSFFVKPESSPTLRQNNFYPQKGTHLEFSYIMRF